jgi:hypothetical protein
MFFDPRKFDFSRVGRLKFNIKMGKPERDRIEDPLLSAKDFYEVVGYVLKMRKNPSEYQADDIDHLGNRRVRAVGELLENQFRIGLERMERAIKEKMSIHQEMQTTMPRDLINALSQLRLRCASSSDPVSFPSSWIRRIHFPKLLTSADFRHLDLVVFLVNVPVSKFVTCTPLTMDVSVLLRRLKVQTSD